MDATPLTRPPGSELAITPSTSAPLRAIVQSPSTIAFARFATKGSPVLFDLVESEEVVITPSARPEASVNFRGGGGGGGGGCAGAGADGGSCAEPPGAGTGAVFGGAGAERSLPAGGGLAPPGGWDAAACSEVFALAAALPLSAPESGPDFAAAPEEFDESPWLDEQLVDANTSIATIIKASK